MHTLYIGGYVELNQPLGKLLKQCLFSIVFSIGFLLPGSSPFQDTYGVDICLFAGVPTIIFRCIDYTDKNIVTFWPKPDKWVHPSHLSFRAHQFRFKKNGGNQRRPVLLLVEPVALQRSRTGASRRHIHGISNANAPKSGVPAPVAW